VSEQTELDRREAARRRAELLHDADAVQAAIDRMAAEVARDLASANPILLTVMTGGIVPAVWLSTRLDFPHQIDYLHATRYVGDTRGGKLEWRTRPRIEVAGRSVLIVDDILDEGITLQAVARYCREQGAAEVRIAALVRKRHERNRAGVEPDYLGLEVPDRYVFGCGMDYQEYYRNLPAIYALSEEDAG
jgi:hypoxanthine phosphoribosyltransferase